MIKVRVEAQNPRANLGNYDDIYRSFSWSDFESNFTWSETGKMNIVHEAVDRWTAMPDKSDSIALIFEKTGYTVKFTYRDLKRISCRWANLFKHHGLKYGDRLILFLEPCPEYYFALLACARSGIIFCPMYSTLSPEEMAERLLNSKPRGIITSPELIERLPLEASRTADIVYLTHGPVRKIFPEEIIIPDLQEDVDDECEPVWVENDTPLSITYIPDSNGPSKGIIHSHGGMSGYLMTARYALDLKEGDVLRTDGDPAWLNAVVYGAFAPWLCRATSVIQGNPFSVHGCYRTLERHRVDAWYTTPGTLNNLKKAGEKIINRYDLSQLRHLAVAGNHLNPDVFFWVKENLNIAPHDMWGMTEIGMIGISNFPAMDIKPGSIGKPVPGIEAAVVDENGTPLSILSLGELALKTVRPGSAMMTGIWRNDQRYREYFRECGLVFNRRYGHGR